jgi:hypothetical protein
LLRLGDSHLLALGASESLKQLLQKRESDIVVIASTRIYRREAELIGWCLKVLAWAVPSHVCQNFKLLVVESELW